MMSSNESHPEQPTGVGQRLRSAREAQELTIAEVAGRLRVPVRVIESLEADDGARLGAPVFVRGHVRSYARLLKLPVDSVAPVGQGTPIQPPELTPRTFVSPMQRFTEKAMGRMVYVVITAFLFVPIWVVTRPHVTSPGGIAASLDLPVGREGAVSPAPVSPAPVDDRPRPVIASMAPMPRPAPADATVAALELQFNGDSWFQAHAPDGRSLEETLVRSGETRRFPAGEVGRIVLGNASAVDVSANGTALDLAPYRRANVARFTVSSDGSLAPPAE